MNDRLSKLIKSFSSYISVPWGAFFQQKSEQFLLLRRQKADELKLRVHASVNLKKLSGQSNHGWLLLDITNSFPEWMAELDYVEGYLKTPNI